MKIMYNDECLIELTDIQKKILCSSIREDVLEEHIQHLARYFIQKKYDEVYKKLHEEWLPKLTASGVKMVPTNPEEFAQLVFAHPDYQCRITRDEHEKKLLEETRS